MACKSSSTHCLYLLASALLLSLIHAAALHGSNHRAHAQGAVHMRGNTIRKAAVLPTLEPGGRMPAVRQSHLVSASIRSNPRGLSMRGRMQMEELLVTGPSEGPPRLPNLRSGPMSVLRGGIPRIIHQMFFPGAEQLLKAEAVTNGHFKRDWRMSCQTHNPGWRYIFWDMRMSELLLEQRYPWFLETFKAMDTIVVKSDAMRPFILDTYGGVYVDMDIECLGPLDSVLANHSLVLQAQTPDLINNGQMASVPGHPLWALMQQRAGLMGKATIGKKLEPHDVVKAVGPDGLTEEFRKYIHQDTGSVPGIHTDKEYKWPAHRECSMQEGGCPPPSIQVYAPKEWFEACTWDDLGCQQQLAETVPFLRALNAARALSLRHLPPVVHHPSNVMIQILKAALDPHSTESRKILYDDYKRQLSSRLHLWRSTYGVHHFSGSWMESGGKTQEHKETVRKMFAQGLVKFFSTSDFFVELQPGPAQQQQHMLPQQAPATPAVVVPSSSLPVSTTTSGQADQRPVRMLEALPLTPGGEVAGWLADVLAPLRGVQAWRERPVRTGCNVISVTLFRNGMGQGIRTGCCQDASTEFQSRTLKDLSDWTSHSGCHLHVITDGAPTTNTALAQVAAQPRAQLVGPPLHVPPPGGPQEEEGATEEVYQALSDALSTWRQQRPNGRMTMVHISAPGSVVWSLLKRMNAPGNLGLLDVHPTILLVDSGQLAQGSELVLQPAYQHLYQEIGYQGYYHQIIGSSVNNTSDLNVCAQCFLSGQQSSQATEQSVLPALRLGFTRFPRRPHARW